MTNRKTKITAQDENVFIKGLIKLIGNAPVSSLKRFLHSDDLIHWDACNNYSFYKDVWENYTDLKDWKDCNLSYCYDDHGSDFYEIIGLETSQGLADALIFQKYYYDYGVILKKGKDNICLIRKNPSGEDRDSSPKGNPLLEELYDYVSNRYFSFRNQREKSYKQKKANEERKKEKLKEERKISLFFSLKGMSNE